MLKALREKAASPPKIKRTVMSSVTTPMRGASRKARRAIDATSESSASKKARRAIEAASQDDAMEDETLPKEPAGDESPATEAESPATEAESPATEAESPAAEAESPVIHSVEPDTKLGVST
jgi:hypothetical protein